MGESLDGMVRKSLTTCCARCWSSHSHNHPLRLWADLRFGIPRSEGVRGAVKSQTPNPHPTSPFRAAAATWMMKLGSSTAPSFSLRPCGGERGTEHASWGKLQTDFNSKKAERTAPARPLAGRRGAEPDPGSRPLSPGRARLSRLRPGPRSDQRGALWDL